MKPPLTRVQARLLYVAGWLPLLLLHSATLRQTGVAPTVPLALLYAGSYIAPAVAVGALVWQIGRRVRWHELSWPKFIGVEIILGVGFLSLWHAFFLGWLWLVAGRDAAVNNARTLVGWELLMALLIVAVHSAVFHAVRILGALREKELAAAEAEALRIQSEMQALRGQLDPHFLFNSLHSITALVREDSRRAEDALLQFSDLLRRVLDVRRDASDEVQLSSELKFIDDYLAIERLRLGDRLRVVRELSADALDCWVPAFTVQPLVENAIHHAIAPRRDGGEITIHAAVSDGSLVIEVSDNGPGADPKAVAAADGVGLSAIRRRLQLRYGAAAKFDIVTAAGEGFRVRLALPAETAPLLDTHA
jgi:two-component system, LytTR family, sensor kinase